MTDAVLIQGILAGSSLVGTAITGYLGFLIARQTLQQSQRAADQKIENDRRESQQKHDDDRRDSDRKAEAAAIASRVQEVKEVAASAATEVKRSTTAAAVKVAEVKESADKAARMVAEVKDTLEVNSTLSNTKLDAIHTLVNSKMSAALKIAMDALERVAGLTQAKIDIDAAQTARDLYDDHAVKQAEVDAEIAADAVRNQASSPELPTTITIANAAINVANAPEVHP